MGWRVEAEKSLLDAIRQGFDEPRGMICRVLEPACKVPHVSVVQRVDFGRQKSTEHDGLKLDIFIASKSWEHVWRKKVLLLVHFCMV